MNDAGEISRWCRVLRDNQRIGFSLSASVRGMSVASCIWVLRKKTE